MKYSTKTKFYDSLSAPKKFLDRPSIIFREFCFANQFKEIDKDPLCVPQDENIYNDKELVDMIQRVNTRPMTENNTYGRQRANTNNFQRGNSTI